MRPQIWLAASLLVVTAACASEETKGPGKAPVLAARSIDLGSSPPGTPDYVVGRSGAARDATEISVFADEGLEQEIGRAAVEKDGSFRAVLLGDNEHAQLFVAARSGDRLGDPLLLENDIEAPPLVLRADSVVGPRGVFSLDCGGQSCGRTFSLDGAPFAACGPLLELQGLDGEAHQLRARATDEAGNVAEVAFDWQAPAVVIEEAPADPSAAETPRFAFGCEEEACTFTCSLDGDDFVPCSSPWAPAPLEEGLHDLRIRATDEDGVTGFAVEHTWRHDRTPPELAIESGPPARTAERDARFTIACEEGCVTECAVDGVFAPCQGAVVYSGVADGRHTFEVRGVDAAGNVSTATAHWEVDTSAPVLTVEGLPDATTDRTWALVQPACEGSCSITCSLDGGEPVDCDRGMRLEGLDPGPHQLRIEARGELGVTAAVEHDFTVRLPTWAQIDAGTTHLCAIDEEQQLYCWGGNERGQVGNGSLEDAPEPARMPGLWQQVDAGWQTTCAIDHLGALHCWGSNVFGQLGQGDLVDRSEPTRVGTEVDWRHVAVGAGHVCGIRGGSLWCWGRNQNGAAGDLGYGQLLAPTQVGTATDWELVAAGGDHSCGIRGDGALWCWGHGMNGELGSGILRVSATPSQVPGTWSAVSAGTSHTCATGPGGAHCWGDNARNQIGPDDLSYTPEPVAMGWSTAVAGAWHTCGIAADGALLCRGQNDRGQSGGADGRWYPTVVTVAPPGAWTEVVAGDANSCARRADGTAWCWGGNQHGQLLRGIPAGERRTPVPVFGVRDAVEVVAGDASTCFRDAEGRRSCAGENVLLALGDGTSVDRPFVERIGGQRWTELALSHGHGCGLDDEESLWCWGGYSLALRGEGPFMNPTPMDDGRWVDLAGGWDHGCAIGTTGSLWCWGSNYRGEAGLGSGMAWSNAPMRLPGSDWSTVEAFHRQTCGVQGTGTAWCWGHADGRTRYEPVRVAPAYDDFVAIAPGGGHFCALRANGALHCQGSGTSGQLGDGNAADSLEASVEVPGTWSAFAVGWRHTCAIATAGTLHCWGANDSGQAAAGDAVQVAAPHQIGEATDWVSVAAGTRHTCAVRANGTAACWGESGAGQLGDGSATRIRPVGISRAQ